MRLGSSSQMPSDRSSNTSLSNIATNKNNVKSRAKTRKLTSRILLSHVAIVALIISLISIGYRSPVEANTPIQANRSVLEQPVPTVDQIAAADVAANVAQSADMLVQTNVSNLSISLNAKNELAQTDNALLNKPQIVQQSSAKRGISKYVAKQGDTVKSVASAHGISDDTMRWANNLTSDALNTGQEYSVPSTTGVVYTVQSGDDAGKIAEKFGADKDRIVTYNDAELGGLKPGQQIIVPDGVLPENERPGYSSPRGAVRTYSAPRIGISGFVAGGNSYDRGYCTWWAFNRRAEMGRPIGNFWGNASSWAYYARSAGFTVNNSPSVGAVMQNGGGWGGYGHVAVVERVHSDGSITVSEMNYQGWNVKSERTISAGQARGYNYIH